MRLATFDKTAAVAIVLAVAFTAAMAATSWTWFPTPGEWGDIARIPKGLANYVAFLLPPVVLILWIFIRRRIVTGEARKE